MAMTLDRADYDPTRTDVLMAPAHLSHARYVQEAMLVADPAGKLSFPQKIGSRTTKRLLSKVSRGPLGLKFRRGNTLTKCNRCVALGNDREDVNIIDGRRYTNGELLAGHLRNVGLDRDYIASEEVVSVCRPNHSVLIKMDAMSKEATALPLLHGKNAKNLSALHSRMPYQLHMAIVCRRREVEPYQFLQDTMGYLDAYLLPSSTGADHILSLLLVTLSNLDVLPPNIIVNLDNAPSNKSKTILYGILMMMLAIPELSTVTLFYLAVGHTHNELDRRFSVVREKLNSTDITTTHQMKDVVKSCGVSTIMDTIPLWAFREASESVPAIPNNIFSHHAFQLTRTGIGIELRCKPFIRSHSYVELRKAAGTRLEMTETSLMLRKYNNPWPMTMTFEQAVTTAHPKFPDYVADVLNMCLFYLDMTEA
uniref:VP7 n=1 Tax=Bursaphelenchus xylophilus TaxID=6326 RepID=A0A1I7SFX0_BURXY